MQRKEEEDWIKQNACISKLPLILIKGIYSKDWVGRSCRRIGTEKDFYKEQK